MDKLYTVDEQHVTLKYGEITEQTDLPNFMAEMGRVAPFHTGLLPPGLRSWSQMGEYTQVLMEAPPGINLTYWGQYESDRSADLLELAQPYRVILGNFKNGVLEGARMFYSPVPITSAHQQLYHINLPNVNCRGYGGTGVGWLCLYHRNLVPENASWHHKLQQLLERVSGAEAYNDANMSETDGTRFYKAHKKPSFLWNKKEWERKSEKEGWEWTLDPDLWIPIKVASIHAQGKHVASGVPLTVGGLLEGGAAEYYTHRGGNADVKSHQKMRQGETPSDVLKQTFDMAFAKRNTKVYGVDARNASPTDLVEAPKSVGKVTVLSKDTDGKPCTKCEKPTTGTLKVGGDKIALCPPCGNKNSYCLTCKTVKQNRYFYNSKQCMRCKKEGAVLPTA